MNKKVLCVVLLTTIMIGISGCGNTTSKNSSEQTKESITIDSSRNVSDTVDDSAFDESRSEESSQEEYEAPEDSSKDISITIDDSALDESKSEESSQEEYKDPEYTLGKIVDTGKYGENITWELDENGLLVISGSGECNSHEDSYVTINALSTT